MSIGDEGGESEAAAPARKPFVTVVIPARDAERYLPYQLQALETQAYDGAWEVLVADNGSMDRTAAVVADFEGRIPGIRVIDAAKVRGPAHARNAGAAQARGEMLLFCDADDVVGRDWVEAMVRGLRSSPLAAGVGARDLDPVAPPSRDSMAPSPDRFPFLAWNKSANLGIWRRVFFEVGGFDERRQTGEDVDLCWRVQLAGYRMVFVPDARVLYRERDDLGALLRRRFTFGYAAHELYEDYREHGAPPPNLRWALRNGLRLLTRSPKLLAGRESRHRWLATSAGLLGRLWAVLRSRRFAR